MCNIPNKTDFIILFVKVMDLGESFYSGELIVITALKCNKRT